MLKIGFWTDEPRLILDADESRDLIRLGRAISAVAHGRSFKVPGPDGYALVGVAYLQIECGVEQLLVTDGSIVLTLSAPAVAELVKKIEHMAGSPEPCHNYVDLRDLAIIVSLGEGRLPA